MPIGLTVPRLLPIEEHRPVLPEQLLQLAMAVLVTRFGAVRCGRKVLASGQQVVLALPAAIGLHHVRASAEPVAMWPLNPRRALTEAGSREEWISGTPWRG